MTRRSKPWPMVSRPIHAPGAPFESRPSICAGQMLQKQPGLRDCVSRRVLIEKMKP